VSVNPRTTSQRAQTAPVVATQVTDVPAGGLALLWRALLAQRKHALLGITAGLAWSVGKLLAPTFLRSGIDLGIAAGDPAALRDATVALLVVGTTNAVIAGLRRFLAQSTAARVEADLRARLFSHLLTLDLGFHARSPAGQLVTRTANDLQQIQHPIINIPLTVSNIVMFAGASIAIAVLDPTLALVALGPPLCVFLIARRFAFQLAPRARILQQLGTLASALEETVSGIRAIKGLGLEGVERGRVEQQTRLVHDAALRLNDARALYVPLMDLMPMLGLAWVLWLGGQRVIEGTLSVGRLVQFNYYVLMLVGPLRLAGMTVAQLQRAVVSADLIAALLARKPAIADGPRPRALPELQTQARGEVRFEAVEFGYGDDPALLSGLDFHVRAGETVALVGATGAGKTSVISLLARFYETRRGRVTVDGVDVREARLADLRSSVGIVFEDPFLFSGSVRDNIAFAQPDASVAEIERAARGAGAHDFIVSLAEGYDTHVGERGFSLSGGQRQRIALARALLTDPRVLVLDSATSAVDASKEQEISEAMASSLRGRTTIVVAHRPATLRRADRVLVLEGGRIVDSGSHDALVARSEVYRRILASEPDSQLDDAQAHKARVQAHEPARPTPSTS